MPRQREEILNGELGKLLIDRHPSWNEANVHIDSTETIRAQSGLKIDVLVENPGGQPVAIETKFDTSKVGTALREHLEDRIGLTIDQTGSVIESGISVVYPAGLTSSGVAGATLRYAVHQLGQDDTVKRWPEEDDEWIEGSVDDLADAVEVVSLSEKRIREGEELLSDGVQDASSRLQAVGGGIGFNAALAEVLHQEQGQQTTRMSVAIIVNAFVFHYAIEGQDDIPDVSEGSGKNGYLKSRVLKIWEAVLEVNYWPIFGIAKDILETVPTRTSQSSPRQGERGGRTASDGRSDDVPRPRGANVFRHSTRNRKFLATFYTLPESASLVAALAVSRLDVDWTNEESVKALKIADFACGTGTLLSAAQRAIYRRLRRAGFNDEEFHQLFMERVLLGTDIMPSAVHLTASMLSSAHPGVGYDSSLVRVLPFGVDEELSTLRRIDADTPYIGALDLRLAEFGHSLFTQEGLGPQVEIGGRRMTAKKAKDADTGREFPVEHASFDLVIMNPPFTRPTGHEAGKIGVPVPSFAGIRHFQGRTIGYVQKAQGADQAVRTRQRGTSIGVYGLGSRQAEVRRSTGPCPSLFLRVRSGLEQCPGLRSHAGTGTYILSPLQLRGTTSMSFSADTGMAECLVWQRGVSPPDRHVPLPLFGMRIWHEGLGLFWRHTNWRRAFEGEQP